MKKTFKEHQAKETEELNEKMRVKGERLKNDRFLNALGTRYKVEKPKDDTDDKKQ